EAIHEQLVRRSRLSNVLVHLEGIRAEDPEVLDPLIKWAHAQIRQVNALISPSFLDLSRRTAKVEFREPKVQPGTEEVWMYYGFPEKTELQFWSIDEEKGLASSVSARE